LQFVVEVIGAAYRQKVCPSQVVLPGAVIVIMIIDHLTLTGGNLGKAYANDSTYHSTPLNTRI
jgi:hypothetical protein